MVEPLTLAVGVIALIGLGLTFFGGHFRLAQLRKQDALRDLHREIAAAEASRMGDCERLKFASMTMVAKSRAESIRG